MTALQHIRSMLGIALMVGTAAVQAADPPKPPAVNAIAPPRYPLPAEELSVGITNFSFLVYGDTRGRRDGKELQYEHSLIIDSMLETIQRMRRTSFPVRFALHTGDHVVNDRSASHWNTSFVGLINRLSTDGGIPCFLAPGNHDIIGAKAADEPKRKESLTNYLWAASNLIPPPGSPRRLSKYGAYSFGYGNSFFLTFESNIASDEKQFQWIADQLKALDRTRYPNVFAFFHHPPFSSGPNAAAGEPTTLELRTRYLPLFRTNHLAALFCGHEHLFEHWVEKYEQSGKRYRLDHIISGGGGAPLHGYRGEPDTSSYVKTNSAEKVTLDHIVIPGLNPGNNPYHYVIVYVDGTEIRFEVIGIDWGKDFQPYRAPRTELTRPDA
jgi:3',5'-cyclic AMP phosphodiesterase CpdA